MKKWVFPFLSATFCLCGIVVAQAPQPQQINPPIHVKLLKPNGELDVGVRPWRIHINSRTDRKYLEWRLDGNSKDLVSRMTVDNRGKVSPECPPFPPTTTEYDGENLKVVMGPFETETTTPSGWCSYNILLYLTNGESTYDRIKIDPDYRVGPGTPVIGARTVAAEEQ